MAASVLLNLNSANLIPQALALIVQRRQLPTCHARRARPHSTHTSKIGHLAARRPGFIGSAIADTLRGEKQITAQHVLIKTGREAFFVRVVTLGINRCAKIRLASRNPSGG
ncbi:MAG TPA: hypothetical protein VGB07_16805 [Blastocatellia bacterium]